MSRKIIFIFVVIVTASTADLQTAALTVYRNPEFFRHLSEEFNNHLNKFTPDSPETSDEYQPIDDSNYFHQYNTEFNPDYSPTEVNENNHAEEHRDQEDNDNDTNVMEHEEDDRENHNNNEQDERDDDYKYPGEPKKPNPTAQPDVNVHYDPSPDFNPPPRDIKPSAKKPKARPPFGHPRHAQDKYIDPTNLNHQPYEYDHGRLESIPVHSQPQNVDEPEEYLTENIPYPSRNHLQEMIHETKKGTREFLKHNTLPANHELEDLRSMQRQPVRVSCATRIKAKKPRTYIAYKVRPIYPRYRVVPLSRNRLTTVYFVKRNALMKRRRNAPQPTSDDSAYLINSAFDDDYQRVLQAN